jgi:outer membrane protein assembly factor BamE (lipoprotein component of BamABCDE complex)
MKKPTAIGIAVAATLFAGCATYQQGRPWWTLNEQSFVPLAPATTTKDDVQRLVGKPLMSMTFPNLGEDVWDYRFLNGTRTYIAEVHFDAQGRTKYYTTYPDRCPLGPMGCR